MLDSGASSHIAVSQSGMSDLRTVETEKFNTFGNGSKAKVEAVGDIVLKIPGSEVETVTLTDMFHVPDATINTSPYARL